jgi:acyl-coenzyme A synthetase/AMP-(fatty) acid ligase
MNKTINREEQTLLIASLVLGAVAAGALSWLCFTRSGNTFVKSRIKDFAALLVCRDTGLSHKLVRQVMDAIID